MSWYDDLQRQAEKCAGNETMLRELLCEVGVRALIAQNEGDALPRRKPGFNALCQRLFRRAPDDRQSR